MSMTHEEIKVCKIVGRVLREGLPFGSEAYKIFAETTKVLEFVRVLTENKPAIIEALSAAGLKNRFYSHLSAEEKAARGHKDTQFAIQQIIDNALVEGNLPNEADLPTYRGKTYRDYMNDRHWALLRDVIIIAYMDSTNVAA